MKLDEKKRLEKRIAAGVLAAGLFFTSSLLAFANGGSKEKDGFIVTGSNSISSTQAYGETSGGSGAYRNRVIVYDHNKAGEIIGSSESTGVAEAKASAKVFKFGSYKVVSLHSIINSANDSVVVGLSLTDSL